MITRLWRVALVATALLATSGCETVPPAAHASDGTVDVRQAMIDGVNPAALAIWELGNRAVDERGEPDSTKLDPHALAQLRESAQILKTYAQLLAEAPILKASGPDLVAGRLPEGIASREQIQAAIDSDPDGFRAYSRAMGSEAEALLSAIQSSDRDAVANRIATFDGACQSCHERYWYVSQ